jgi:hypothetical protein
MLPTRFVIVPITPWVDDYHAVDPVMRLYPVDVLFEGMNRDDAEDFYWQMAFHGHRAGLIQASSLDQAYENSRHGWYNINSVVKESLFATLGGLCSPSDYVFHHWLSPSAAVFEYDYGNHHRRHRLLFNMPFSDTTPL